MAEKQPSAGPRGLSPERLAALSRPKSAAGCGSPRCAAHLSLRNRPASAAPDGPASRLPWRGTTVPQAGALRTLGEWVGKLPVAAPPERSQLLLLAGGEGSADAQLPADGQLIVPEFEPAVEPEGISSGCPRGTLAVRSSPGVSRRLRQARVTARRLAECDRVEREQHPHRAASPFESPAQQGAKRARARVAELADRAARTNAAALRGLAAARRPLPPTLGPLRYSAEAVKDDPPDDLDLELQLRERRPLIMLGSAGLAEEELMIVLGMLASHAGLREIYLDDVIVTPRVLGALEELAELNDTLSSIHGGLWRDALGTVRRLELPEGLSERLRSNLVRRLAAERSDLEFHAMQEKRKGDMAAAALAAALGEAEGQRRGAARCQEQAERAQLRRRWVQRRRALLAAERREERERQVAALLAQLDAAEGAARPALELQARQGSCGIAAALEASCRDSLAREQMARMREVRREMFDSWEASRKQQQLRFRGEAIGRKKFGVLEARGRLELSEREAQQRLWLHGECEGSWSELQRVLGMRDAKAEEEFRRELQRQHEDDNQRQWQRERIRKEQERWETEKQRGRDKIGKEEKRVRGLVRRVEECVRQHLGEAAIVSRTHAELETKIGVALAEREHDLRRRPELRLSPDTPGHHSFFILGTEDWVPIVPPAVFIVLAMPLEWKGRVHNAEEKAKKAYRQEQVHRPGIEKQLHTCAQQIRSAAVVEGQELPWAAELYEGILLTAADECAARKRVSFPPLDMVEEEKLRVWGGRVQVTVSITDEADGSPPQTADRVRLGGEHNLHSEAPREGGQMTVYLPSTGKLRPSHLAVVLRDIQYRSAMERPNPWARQVRTELRLTVFDVCDTTVLLDPDLLPQYLSEKKPGAPPTRRISRPVPAQTIELCTHITTFVCIHPPYLLLRNADGRLGTAQMFDVACSRTWNDFSVPALALYPKVARAQPLSPTVGIASSAGGPWSSACCSSGSAPLSDEGDGIERRAAAPGRQGVPVTPFNERDHQLIPLLPALPEVDHPPYCLFNSETGKLVVRPGSRQDALMTNYAHGKLVVAFEKGYTSDDLILIGDEASVDMDTRTVSVEGSPIGVIDPTFAVRRTPPITSAITVINPAAKEEDKSGHASRVEALVLHMEDHPTHPSKLRAFISSLRYSNPSKNPTMGLRRMILELFDHQGRGNAVRWQIDVKWIDRPAELRIDDTKLVFRPPCHTDVPAHYLQYFEPNKLLIAAQGKLVDVDTDRFCGGYMNVRINAPTAQLIRTDGICILPNPEPAVGLSHELSKEKFPGGADCYNVLFNGVPFGRACFTKPWDGIGEPIELSVDFLSDGSASIQAAQALLRSICFYSTELQNVGQGTRQIDINVLIGPTMMKMDVDGNIIEHAPALTGSPLSATVLVRAAAPLIKVPTKHIHMRYFEGSGAKRLGPFDILQEEDQFGKEYGGGFLKAEIIDCAEEEDVLKLQEGHGIRITLVSDADTDVDHPDVPADWRRRKSSVLVVPGLQPEEEDPFASAGAFNHVSGAMSSLASGILGGARRRKSQARDSESGPEPRQTWLGNSAFGGTFVAQARRGSRRESTAAALIFGGAGAGRRASMKPRDPLMDPAQAAPQGGVMQSVKDRIRNRIRDVAVNNIVQRRQLLGKAFDQHVERLKERRRGLDTRFRKGRASKSEVHYEDGSGRYHLGTLFVSLRGALLLQFSQKAKKAHVTAALRCVAYAHESCNPQELDKKVRVSLADASLTPTQCICEVSIQPVDDVTEFRLASERLLYRQGTVGSLAVGAFRVAGLTQGWLVDPDTQYFDGGSLTVELTGGLGRSGSDQIGFLTVEQQERQYELESAADIHSLPEVVRQSFRQRPLLELVDGDPSEPRGSKKVMWGNVHIASFVHLTPVPGASKTKAGFFGSHSEFPGSRLNFVPRKTGGEGPPEHAVPLWLASYMLNCLTYANTAERVKDGTRTLRLEVRDPENTTPGRAQIILDVSGPILYVPGFRAELSYGGQEPLPVFPGASVTIGDHKPITKGYFEAAIGDGDARDVLRINWLKLNLQLKEQSLLEVHGKSQVYLGRAVQTQHSFRLEFTWASKITQKQLQAIVRIICYSREELPKDAKDAEDECIGETRNIMFALCDGNIEPNICTAVVTIGGIAPIGGGGEAPVSLAQAVGKGKAVAKAFRR